MTDHQKELAELGDLATPLWRDPTDQHAWCEALQLICRVLGASSATLGAWCAHTATLRDPIAYTWSPQAAEQFFERYQAYEPLARRWRGWIPELRDAGRQRLFTGAELLPEAWRSDDDRIFYEEFADPHGIGHVGGILMGDGQGQVIGLYLYRDEDFERRELEGLHESLECLQSAIGSRRQTLQKDAMADALHREGEANLFVDGDRHVHMKCAGAESILARAGVSIDARGRLTSNRREHVQLIDSLLRGPRDNRRGVLADHRGPRFVVTVTPCPSPAPTGVPTTFHVCILDLWREKRPAAAELGAIFPALTATEARVASWAVTYLSRKDIARKLKMSDRTVQVHMRRIYEKTGINQLESARDKNHRALLRRLLSALVDFE